MQIKPTQLKPNQFLIVDAQPWKMTEPRSILFDQGAAAMAPAGSSGPGEPGHGTEIGLTANDGHSWMNIEFLSG
jgi:hypothetical protein